jgi:hypothetical protein
MHLPENLTMGGIVKTVSGTLNDVLGGLTGTSTPDSELNDQNNALAAQQNTQTQLLQQQKDQQAQALTQQQNALDLANQNQANLDANGQLTNVVAGGTAADSAASTTDDLLKRKRQGTGLASQLGVNI